MADTAVQENDLGELRGQVRGLQTGFESLGREVRDGLKGLTEYIRVSTEKTDERINAQGQRTDARFEALAQSQLTQLGQKGSAQWTIFAYIGSTVFALAGLAATFYSITRGPIDASFAELKATSISLGNDIKTMSTQFVPLGQEKIEREDQQRRLDVVATRLHDQEKLVYMQDATLVSIQKELDQERANLKDLQATAATRTQISDLTDRVTTTSNRLQTVYDKNYIPSTSSSSPPPISGSPGR